MIEKLCSSYQAIALSWYYFCHKIAVQGADDGKK
jgi:hypothetical protein